MPRPSDRRPLARWLRAALLVGLVLAAAATGAWLERRERGPSVFETPGVQVALLRNGVLRGSLPFRFQRFDDPRLATLREREHLDTIVAGADTEFQKILRLKDWVAAQWPNSEPNPYPPWNALLILDWIRAGKTGGFCAQYSQVLLQGLASLGLTARYVEIGSADNPYRHYPIEVWSNDFDKWLVLDPAFNLHFERQGIPLSALEVHQALVRGRTAEVRPVLGAVRQGHDDPMDYPQRTMELYYYLRFHLKADHLTNPEEAFDRRRDMVEWQDADTVPWERSTVASQFTKERLTERATSSERDAYPPLNQVRIVPRRLKGDVLVVGLQHDVREFAAYEVSVAEGGTWQRQTRQRYPWTLVPGDNVLRVRGVNSRGVAGPPAVMRIVRAAAP